MMDSFHLVDIFGWKTNVFRHVALEALSYYALTPKLFNFFWIDTLIFEIKLFERKHSQLTCADKLKVLLSLSG